MCEAYPCSIESPKADAIDSPLQPPSAEMAECKLRDDGLSSATDGGRGTRGEASGILVRVITQIVSIRPARPHVCEGEG